MSAAVVEDMSTLALALGLAFAASGCTSRPAPCEASERCTSGQMCTAGRCTPPGAEIAPETARRVLVAATEIAVVSSHATDDGALPSAIPVGTASGGSVVVLLRFPASWGNRARVTSAFLTLEPATGAVPAAEAQPISVARVLEPWSASDVTWGRLPRLSAPEARGLATASPPKTLRIDVTAIVQRWARAKTIDHGIALLTGGKAPTGATYATGASGERGPRLDVYLR